MAHVLLIEDDPAQRLMAGIALRHAGHEVREAEDGAVFCDQVQRETGLQLHVASGPEEARLAPVVLAYAEETYDVLSLKFGHTVTERVPIVVYASHSDFEQTNILPFTPPEGLLGATDFLKRRVIR